MLKKIIRPLVISLILQTVLYTLLPIYDCEAKTTYGIVASTPGTYFPCQANLSSCLLQADYASFEWHEDKKQSNKGLATPISALVVWCLSFVYANS